MTPSQRTVVLVVDDDPRVRAALAQLLAAHGVQALSAADAATATTSGPAHVALVDTQLPTAREGLALIGELATRVPVVATSVDSALRPAALAAGATAFAEKDGRPDALVHLLHRTARAAIPRSDVGPCPSRTRRTGDPHPFRSYREESAR